MLNISQLNDKEITFEYKKEKYLIRSLSDGSIKTYIEQEDTTGRLYWLKVEPQRHELLGILWLALSNNPH